MVDRLKALKFTETGQGKCLTEKVSLTFRERGRRDVVLVPEAVALLQDLELLAQEAAEGRADDGAAERPLGHAANEQVDVFHVLEV